MRILLAIDSSTASEETVNEVARIPWPPQSTFCVLHVADLFSLPRDGASFGMALHAELLAAESLVKSAADKLSSRGNKAMTAVARGYPASIITEHAAKWGADFIIVGSHGRSATKRFLLGSVAQAVVRHAHCSVDVIRLPGK